KQVKNTIQKNKEKHDQSASRGKKLGPEKLDKFTIGFKKDKSDQSKSRASMKEGKLIYVNLKIVSEIQEKIEVKNNITASLDETKVPNGKTILEIENLFFKYPSQSGFLINDFNLTMAGPERIAIIGENGSGKSTVIKLIRNQLMPVSGKIRINVENIAYLDQELRFLDKNLTLIENFLKLNTDSKIFDAYTALAEFQFRNKDAEKKVRDLSGGERIRAALAISLMSQHPPQLIILDEPTNHLDLRSIEAIENILLQYQGAILAVSHDELFLKNINIDRTIYLIK
ncbi:MAG: ATP-binding cassette domain-containing protein, partial [Gammaproteobacteria bacterium]|nr:ATP-binding cassette domain-containing protein [Gammaproteobacteria bacterium]